VDEPIAERHAKVMRGLSEIDPPWGIRDRRARPAPDLGDELQVEVDLSAYIGPGIKATINYVFRGATYLRDEGHYDDCLFVEFEANTEYRAFILGVFPAYVRAFGAYRAAIVLDEDLALQDWERVVELREATGKDVDGRDSVFRLGPVNYFDRELCRRAFGLAPEDVVRMVQGRVESASMLLDGVFIVGSSQLLDRETLGKLNKVLRDQLAVPR
jgi:hypothetical protein